MEGNVAAGTGGGKLGDEETGDPGGMLGLDPARDCVPGGMLGLRKEGRSSGTRLTSLKVLTGSRLSKADRPSSSSLEFWSLRIRSNSDICPTCGNLYQNCAQIKALLARHVLQPTD